MKINEGKRTRMRVRQGKALEKNWKLEGKESMNSKKE
jgi:hypothetical protein